MQVVISTTGMSSAADARRAVLWGRITQTLGKKWRRKERKYSLCNHVRAIGL